MAHRGLLFVGWVTLAVAGAAIGLDAQERPIDLARLVSDLDLTERGAARWLERLETNENGPSAERLLAVTVTGELLRERAGGPSSVVVGAELDMLLFQPGRSVVLIHNHPSNSSVSAADIGQLARPGVAAVVAIGHDRSVFVAALRSRMDPDYLRDRQYTLAQFEVTRRLRTRSRGRVSMADSDALFTHLIARALDKAGIIQYWFALRGTSRGAYETGRMVFGQVVESAAARLNSSRSPSSQR